MTTSDAPPIPAPPKLIASDRRFDAARWQHVVPPSLAADLGDAPELADHRQTFKRWQQAAERAGELRRQHVRAEAADREAEQAFAGGKTRKLAEPTAPALELELTGAQRAVEALERELVASGKRLFAASLEHVPAAQAALERRLDGDDERVAELVEQAVALLDQRSLAAAEATWLHRAQWETAVAPYLPRAAASRIVAELREVLRMHEHERAEAKRRRREAQIEVEMDFVAPRQPRPPSSRPREERRAEAEQRVREREAAGR